MGCGLGLCHPPPFHSNPVIPISFSSPVAGWGSVAPVGKHLTLFLVRRGSHRDNPWGGRCPPGTLLVEADGPPWSLISVAFFFSLKQEDGLGSHLCLLKSQSSKGFYTAPRLNILFRRFKHFKISSFEFVLLCIL